MTQTNRLTRCSILVRVDEGHSDVVDCLAPPLLHQARQPLRYQVEFVRAWTAKGEENYTSLPSAVDSAPQCRSFRKGVHHLSSSLTSAIDEEIEE